MTESEKILNEKLGRALKGADTLTAANVLHELAKHYYLKYAGEVAHARYKYGYDDGVAYGRGNPEFCGADPME